MPNVSTISLNHLKVREMILSAVINGAISAGIFWAVFAKTDSIPVRGVGGYAFDFMPQSFAIGFFAWFIPGLITRHAAAKSQSAPAVRDDADIVRLFGGALVAALAALATGACLPAAILWFSGLSAVDFAPAFAAKIAYGALLGAAVTRLMLGWLLVTPKTLRQ